MHDNMNSCCMCNSMTLVSDWPGDNGGSEGGGEGGGGEGGGGMEAVRAAVVKVAVEMGRGGWWRW